MRRRAVMAAWVLTAGLALAETAGCNWLNLRGRDEHRQPLPHEVERIQQISERAQAAIDRGDYENARADLVQLVDEEPDSPEALQRLGTVLMLQGRYAEAEACFHASLARDHDYVEAMLGLGQVEAQRGDTATALKRFEMAISIDPRRPRAHYLLGRAREAVGQTDEALAAYFRALEFNANDAQVDRPDRGHPARAEPARPGALAARPGHRAGPGRRRCPGAAGPGALEAAPHPRSDRRPEGRRAAAARTGRTSTTTSPSSSRPTTSGPTPVPPPRRPSASPRPTPPSASSPSGSDAEPGRPIAARRAGPPGRGEMLARRLLANPPRFFGAAGDTLLVSRRGRGRDRSRPGRGGRAAPGHWAVPVRVDSQASHG